MIWSRRPGFFIRHAAVFMDCFAVLSFYILPVSYTHLDVYKRQVFEIAAQGGTILFVGTKKQAQDAVKVEAERCGMYYVNERWLRVISC